MRVLPPTSPGVVTLSEIVAERMVHPVGEDSHTSKEGLVYICEGIPPLPTRIVASIEKGDFIELSELLPKSPAWEDDSYTEVADKVILISKTKPKRKVIQDIETWIEAFCTFAAVRGRKHPKLIPDLMAYAAVIAKSARDYGGQNWMVYDYRFRQLAAAKHLTSGWGQKDMALWNETFLKPKQADSASPEATTRHQPGGKKRPMEATSAPPVPKKGRKNEKSWRSQVCYAFSYSGKCTKEKCDYLHVCYDCGEGHSQTACPKKSS